MTNPRGLNIAHTGHLNESMARQHKNQLPQMTPPNLTKAKENEYRKSWGA